MILLIAAVLAAAPQDAARDGWKAVGAAIERGEAARAELEKATKGPDRDTAFRAQAALAEIETLAALKLKPPPRTQATVGPATQVAAALFKSAGLEVEGVPDTRVTLPAGLAFWDAAEELARQLGGDFDSDEKNAWAFSSKRPPWPTFALGRVRARVTDLDRWTFHALGLPAERKVHLSGTVEGLAGFDAEVFGGHARIVEARDDRGRFLEGVASFGMEEKCRERRGSFNASFTLADGEAAKLDRLRLVCDFLFRGQEEKVEIRDFAGAKDLKKTFGEIEVTVTRAEPGAEHFALALAFKGPNVAGRFEPDDIALHDQNGKPWERHGGSSGGGGDSYRASADYAPPAADSTPASIRFRLVTTTRKHSVYLEFKDVPLR